MNSEQSNCQGVPFVDRLLTGLVESACRFRWLVLLVALSLCAVSAYVAATRLQYRTQRSDLDNPHKDYQERWRLYLAEFGDDEDIVVVVKGSDRQRMKEALETLAAEVARRPEHFDRLFYKVDLRPLRNRALLYLPAEEIGRIQDNLQNMSMLLDPPLVGRLDPLIGWKSLTLMGLLHEARLRSGKIIPDRPLSADDEQYLTQLHAVTRAAATILDSPADYQSPWLGILSQKPRQQDLLTEPRYFFSNKEGGSERSTLAFLLVRPKKEQGSFTGAHQSVSTLRALVAGVSPKFPDLELGLTGLPVLESDEMRASQKDTTIASWLALAGVALLYLVFFRNWRSPFLTVSTLLVGTAWSLGWLTLTVGHLNILSATFAVMLIGMGDYGVLWVTRYNEELGLGVSVRMALRRTAAGVGPGILTAAVTTALAFYAAMLADFQAVAELGWIAGSGVLWCALSCFTFLPALISVLAGKKAEVARAEGERQGVSPTCAAGALDVLPFGDPLHPSALRGLTSPAQGPPSAHHSPITSHQSWLPFLVEQPRWVAGVSLALALFLALGACRLTYDHNLLHMQARDLDSVRWEETLIEHTAGASWHALSYTAKPQDALAFKAKYERLPGVGQVVEVASLVPQDQERKLEQLCDVQQRLRHLPERGSVIPHSLPKIRYLRTELDCLIGSLQPLVDASSQSLLADLSRSLKMLREKLGDVSASLSAERLQWFEERLTSDLVEDLHRLRDVSTPAGIALEDLPVELRQRYVGKNGMWLLRVFGKNCLWEYGPLEEFVKEIHGVDPDATGKPFATLEGLRAMKQGFQWAGLYALAAILLVLVIDFRKPVHVLAALAPLVMGIVFSLGIMGLCGLPLNPANMIALPLILGVGVDNGVHVLHDYLSQRRRGPYALNRSTGQGILVAALTTMLGFGTLMISHHRGLFSLGFILALGVGCCMLSALVFLPALLRLLSMRAEEEIPAAKAADEVRRRAA